MLRFAAALVCSTALLGLVVVGSGCSAASDDASGGAGPGSGPGSSGTGPGSTGTFSGAGGGGGEGAGGLTGDPKTCAEAAQYKTYLGCDFYPTVTANNVWSLFDYAVVVANAGDSPAEVTVSRGPNQITTETIPPNELRTIYLPWVSQLKGPDADACGGATPLSQTVKLADGAYHLVSSVPVTVYQFSPLQYAPQGGPPGKNWNNCPALGCFLECFSYSNDASLLLPSTAMTGNYRVAGFPGWAQANIGSFLAITGVEDGTTVEVYLGANGAVVGGGGVTGAAGNGQVSFTLQRGEVVELIGTPTSDFSGSLVQSSKPVQVLTGLPCVNVPNGNPYCDHVEESVFPAETLGQRYFVTVPTGPRNTPVGHVVRIVGNVDGTALSYPSGAPAGAPTTIGAGQVVDLGVVSQDFEIVGDKEFIVATFQLGSSLVDPSGGQDAMGDPAQSISTAVEQYRTKYVFLAPSDYELSIADIVMPTGAQVTIDGAPIGVTPTPIGSGFGVARVTLGPGNNGAHLLQSTLPVGLQVIGYGDDTSYQYPGGLNLSLIAPPPPIPQ
jgi:hypothetical protein